MKFPYGLADFYALRTEEYFYVDRTAHLRLIEEAGRQLLFLRPRRFGKSLLLSTLENYYDLAKADEFDRLFGNLEIGRNPTPKRNQYFVLKWDFSAVDPSGTAEQVRDSLHNHVNQRIRVFAECYQAHLPRPIQINDEDALVSFQSLLGAVKLTPHKLYLLIDEYDNFANEILMGGRPASRARYDSLLQGEGALKALFKTIKAAAGGWGLERVFITGVSPVVLSDMTSGYNVAENIYQNPQFNDLCGFTETEIRRALDEVMANCDLPAATAQTAIEQMRAYYNGYRFAEEVEELVYNPTLALYFLKHYQSRCAPPANMLDNNLAMDRGKLSYIAALPDGPRVIADALQDDADLSVAVLADRFGVEDVLIGPQDRTFIISLLYYFGVLTLNGRGGLRKLLLRIPNLVIRKLYLERLQMLLLPESSARQAGQQAAETLYRTGELQPLCDFVERQYFPVFSNRDYLQTNELTVKTAFLTLLFNDVLYFMESEPAVARRYADLTLLVRPDARDAEIYDLLFEFKFIKPGDVNLTGAQVRELPAAELAALPAVREKLIEACAQLPEYRNALLARYPNQLRLRAYAVVALGFERLVWEELPDAAATVRQLAQRSA